MLSKKTKYALSALLVLAQHYQNGRPLLISEIAKLGNIPKKFLELILLELKNNGLLESKKGQGGGYSLKKSPKQIALGGVIAVMSGPISLVSCVNTGTAHIPCEECQNEAICGLKQVMAEVKISSDNILNNTTLADVLEKSDLLKKDQSKRMMFHI